VARYTAKKQSDERRDVGREQTVVTQDDGESGQWALEWLSGRAASRATNADAVRPAEIVLTH
jgi:hypothetical protein